MPERESDLTPIGDVLLGRTLRDPWPPVQHHPWIAFVRRDVPTTSKALRAALGNRSSRLVPGFVNDFAAEFYAWCRSYAGFGPDGGRGPHPESCAVCHDSHYVLTAKRARIICPRWDGDRRECRREQWEQRLPYAEGE